MARGKDFGIAKGWPMGCGQPAGSVLQVTGTFPSATVGQPYSVTLSLLFNGQNLRSTFPLNIAGPDGRTLAQRGFKYDAAALRVYADKVLP